jgi:RND family efflux transporter MFP subunit
MSTVVCPDRQQLSAYLVGRLSDEAAESIAAHLDSCPACQAQMDRLSDTGDTLVAHLRQPTADEPYVDESQCRSAVARARGVLGRPPAEAAAPRLGRTLGEYQLLEELGHGGMGRVYKALHTKLDRVVAAKLLLRGRGSDPQAISRFEREMRAVGRLTHPNIVQAHDAREIEGTPVLIMEFVDGLDLAEIVRRTGALPVAAACELVRQTAAALQCAHEHGLVHRDIKPSNIMLTPAGEVKLLDLGLARFYAETAAGEEMTGSGQAMGTADYMAPEQAADSRSVDIRADLYSLGCTLYKLLAGRAPFAGPEYRRTLDKLNAHVYQPAPPVRPLAPDVPDELEAVVARLLAKDPGDRYATPAELAVALEAFCGGADLPSLAARAMAISSPLPPGESQGEAAISSPLPPGEGQGAGRRSARPLPVPRRRHPVSKSIATGLAFLALMAGAFAAGVLITIKKNGQTYRLEVPPDSHTLVSPEGNATVTIPDKPGTGSLAAVQARPPEEPPLQFGPVIERVVNAVSEGKGGEGLDLVGGKLVDVPKGFGQRSAEEQNKWSTENNVDLVVDLTPNVGFGPAYGKSPALMPQGLKLTVAWNGWEIATGKELRSALASVTPEYAPHPRDSGSSVWLCERHGVTYYIPSGLQLVTFALQTRKGDLGILQVLRFTQEPLGLRIRYKLAQPPAATAAINPAAELQALRGPWEVVRVEKGKAAATVWNYRQNPAGMAPESVTRLEFGRRDSDPRDFDILDMHDGMIWELRYRIDPAATPKTIDFYERSDKDKGWADEPVAVGIYDVQGDQLKICLASCAPSAIKGDPRPKRLAVDPDSGDVLLVLRRFSLSSDERLFQGTWAVEANVADGQSVPAAELRGLKYSFSGGAQLRIDMTGAGVEGTLTGFFVLDEAKEPKRITLTEDDLGFAMKGRLTLRGIYKFEGDRLHLALSKDGPAPDKFAAPPGSGVTLLVLRKSTEPDFRPPSRAASPALPVVAVSRPLARQVSDYVIDVDSGLIEAAQTVKIQARVSGTLDKIHFHGGMTVKAGEVLLEIDPATFKAEVAKQEAEVQLARLRLKVLTVDSEQAKSLSPPARDRLGLKGAEAEAALLAAQKALEVAQLNLTHATISAPIAGRISRPLLDPGNLVEADHTCLATIISQDPVFVSFLVDQRTAIQLNRPGRDPADRDAAVSISCGLATDQGFPYRGKIDSVDPQVEPGGTVRCRAVVPNPEGILMPGMTARVRLAFRDPQPALLVAESALVHNPTSAHARRPSMSYVWAVNDTNIVEFRHVQIGQQAYGMRVVQEGLRAEDWVVVSADQVPPGSTSGMQVQPQKTAWPNPPPDGQPSSLGGKRPAVTGRPEK